MKVLVASSSVESQELTVLRRLSHWNLSHPGRNNVVSLLDAFENTGPNGRHLCLVFPLMLSDVSQVTLRDYSRSANYVKAMSMQLVLGLSYLHSCNTVHCGQYFETLVAEVKLIYPRHSTSEYTIVTKG